MSIKQAELKILLFSWPLRIFPDSMPEAWRYALALGPTTSYLGRYCWRLDAILSLTTQQQMSAKGSAPSYLRRIAPTCPASTYFAPLLRLEIITRLLETFKDHRRQLIQDKIMTAQTHDPAAFKKPHPLYSSYTSVALSPTAELVTVSGQVAEDPETGETPPDLPSQLSLCLARMSTCLEDAGAKKTDITRLMYYIAQRSVDEMDAREGPGAAGTLIQSVVGKWLEGHRPASCFLRVFGMSHDKFLCEFECMAIVAKETKESKP